MLALLAPRDAERAAAELAVLLAADRAFAPGRAPYALRLPWAGMDAVLTDWIGALAPAEPGGAAEPLAPAEPGVAAEPLAPPEAGAGAAEPEAVIAAAGAAWRSGLAPTPLPPPSGDAGAAYRALAGQLEGEARAIAEALVAAAEATSDEPPPAWIAERLLARFAAAPLRERAAAGLARQAFWPDPLLAAHWTGLLDALDSARTPTEVELHTAHAAACLAVEGDWNVLAHGVLSAPLIAALEHDLDPAPRRAEHARAVAARAAELTGLGPRAALAHPRVTMLLGADPGDHGAEEGEAGFDLVTALRGWREVTGGASEAHAVAGALDRAGVPEPAPQPRPELRWGEPGGQRPPLP